MGTDRGLTTPDIDLAKLDTWFDYQEPTVEELAARKILRASAKEFARVVIQECQPSADRTAALRKLREAVATAESAIPPEGR